MFFSFKSDQKIGERGADGKQRDAEAELKRHRGASAPGPVDGEDVRIEEHGEHRADRETDDGEGKGDPVPLQDPVEQLGEGQQSRRESDRKAGVYEEDDGIGRPVRQAEGVQKGFEIAADHE